MDVRVGLWRKLVPKNWCFWTVVLEKTLESPLDSKEIKPVHSKGNQSWIFIGRTDAEAETPILWPPDAKNWLIWKDRDAGKDWRQVEKGMTEDEMVGWHHRLERHEFEQTQGDGEEQGSLTCCSPRGHKESDTTEQLNWTECTQNQTVSGFFIDSEKLILKFFSKHFLESKTTSEDWQYTIPEFYLATVSKRMWYWFRICI